MYFLWDIFSKQQKFSIVSIVFRSSLSIKFNFLNYWLYYYLCLNKYNSRIINCITFIIILFDKTFSYLYLCQVWKFITVRFLRYWIYNRPCKKSLKRVYLKNDKIYKIDHNLIRLRIIKSNNKKSFDVRFGVVTEILQLKQKINKKHKKRV